MSGWKRFCVGLTMFGICSTSFAAEYLVQLKSGLAAASLESRGVTIERSFQLNDWHLVNVEPEQLDHLLPLVERIEPNSKVTLTSHGLTSDDPRLTEQWGLLKIMALNAWMDYTRGDRRQPIAVIDTGLDFSHPDLRANVWLNAGEMGVDRNGQDMRANGIDDDGNGYIDDYRGWDFVNNDNDPSDDQGHGTAVAGVIGAVGDNGVGISGVSPVAGILPLKVLSENGSGSMANVIAALEYAKAMNVKITNNAWGGSVDSQALRAAIVSLLDSGTFVVAAAGASASDLDLNPSYPGGYNFPNVITVAATDRDDQLATFSNFGPGTVDLGAPGVDVLTTQLGGGYAAISGSVATSHVSGALALIYAHRPELRRQAALAALYSGADELPDLLGRVKSGGRLNVHQSLDQLD